MFSRRQIVLALPLAAALNAVPRRRLIAADPAPVFAPPSASGTNSGEDRTNAEKPKLRQREGAKIVDRRGRFELRGDRYVFLTDEDSVHLLVLENLMLERVANVLADAAGGSLRWSISGTATEFRGSNYLLLERAVVKSSQGDAEPERLADPLAGLKPRTPTSK